MLDALTAHAATISVIWLFSVQQLHSVKILPSIEFDIRDSKQYLMCICFSILVFAKMIYCIHMYLRWTWTLTFKCFGWVEHWLLIKNANTSIHVKYIQQFTIIYEFKVFQMENNEIIFEISNLLMTVSAACILC